jgi:hypothetical protein
MTTSGAAGDAADTPRAADAVRRYLALIESGRAAESDTLADDLEEDFVRHAAAYGARHGVTFAQWRTAGVSAETLWRAGISGGDA